MIGSEKKIAAVMRLRCSSFAYSAAGMERNAYEKLYNTDGSSEKTDCDKRTGDRGTKRTYDDRRADAAGGRRKGCHLCQQNHTCIDPEGIGSMLRTKINVNLGVSRDCKDYDVEMQKVMQAVEMGAHAIMDLSSHGNTIPFRRKLTSECPALIGTVPIYDSVIHYQRDLDTLTARDFIDVVRLHAQDGVDFVTLHCGITRKQSSRFGSISENEHRIQRWFSCICVDVYDRGRKSIL